RSQSPASCSSVERQRASTSTRQERPKGFHWFDRERISVEAAGKLARPNKASDLSKQRMHSMVERFQSPLTTDRVAEESGQNIKDVGASEPSSRNTHALGSLVQDSLLLGVWDTTRAPSPYHGGMQPTLPAGSGY